MTRRLKISEETVEDLTIDGRFRIVDEIGEGASGTVYEGIQLSVDRKVAIKVLHPSYGVRDDFQERFSREAKAIARLSHTNCITLYDFGMSEELESLFMVMEHVEGRELFELMSDQVPLRAAVDYVIQIAGAMEHAHNHNILHRDLKPENVLVTDDGIVKVLDFGMARIMDELASQNHNRLTQQGAVYGTPAYMSPEQCEGDLNVTEQTDLYSLGVILYELVEGRLPFESPQIMKILGMHVNKPVPPISREIPRRLDALIRSMMAKRQVERPSSAGIVADTLRSIMLEIPDGEAQRSTIDASQEIDRTLLQFDNSDQTGEGIRSTLDGVGEALVEPTDPRPPPADDPSGASGETPAEDVSEPPSPAQVRVPESSVQSDAVHETLDPEELDFSSWRPAAIVVLLVAVGAAWTLYALFGTDPTAATDSVDETAAVEAVNTEEEAVDENEVVDETGERGGGAVPAGEPVEPSDEKGVVPEPAAERPPLHPVEEEPESVKSDSDGADPEPPSSPEPVLRETAQPKKRTKKKTPVERPRPKEGSSSSAAEKASAASGEDGKAAEESGTTSDDGSDDKLPKLEFNL